MHVYFLFQMHICGDWKFAIAASVSHFYLIGSVSVAHMSIFPQAFCYNMRTLSSLPLPTMSIKAVLCYALQLCMSSLIKWHP